MADPVNTQQARLLQESISVQAELTRVLKDNLEYQQRIADRSMAESGGLLRAQQQRNMQTLEWANAVQAAQPPDWGQTSTDRRRRSRKLAEAGQASLSGEWRPELPPNQSQSVPEPDQGEPDRLPPNSPTRDYAGMRGLQDPVQQAQQQTDLKGWQRFRQAMSYQQGGFIRRALGGLTSTATLMDQGGGDNLPPDSGGRSVGGGGNNLPHPPNAFGFNTGDEGTQTAMTFAMMGEHGGPAWMRNLYLRAWALNRSVGWAGTATDQLRGDLTDPTSTASRVVDRIPGITQEGLGSALRPLSGALRLAKDHPVATLVGAMSIAGMRDAFGRMADYQPLGQAFGYGPPALGTQSVFGFHNPLGYFGTAAQVGANQVMAEQALQGRIPGFGFGGGLSSQQSQDVMNNLAAQGFRMQPIGGGTIGGAVEIATSAIPGIGKPLAAGEAALAHAMSQLPFGLGDISNSLFGGRGALQGDAATIGQNLDRPLMQQFPGLKAEDINQFTPALRYGGTSIQQLTDELKGLGAGAMATKETIGEFTASIGQTAQAFRGLGSTQQGGVALGMGFTQATGLDPQVASQAAQNPLMQSMALMQYGVLPSGLGDMASGAFTNSTLSTLQLLQGALGGLGRTRYQTVNGVRLPVEQGSQVVYDQIAHMTGLDPNVVKQMLQDAPAEHARAAATGVLGDFTSNTGLAGLVTAAQAGHKNNRMSQADYSRLTADWNKAAVPELQQAGISKSEIAKLGHISGLSQRIQAANTDLKNAAKDDPFNQIKNKPASGQTVNVQLGLTPAAQKLVQQVGPSSSKKSANAGGTSIGSVVNTVTGDLSDAGSWVASHVPITALIP